MNANEQDMNFLILDEVKNIEFSILKKFITFCGENHLRYALTYGTLLGAVRHQGFIPWDDDIDVMMPREDYNSFIEAFEHRSPIEGCELLSRQKTKGYFYPFAKLCDTSTVAKMEDNHTEHGIWLDVFPVDHVPDDEKKARKFHRHIRFYKNMIISYTTDFSTKHRNWKLIPKFFLAMISRIIGVDRIASYIEKESRQFNNEGTRKIAIVSWQSAEGGNMGLDEITRPAKVMFNGLEMNAPADYDAYLRSIYGEYMQLPSENKRTTHHVIAYKTANKSGII